MLNGELGGSRKSSRNCVVSDASRLCWACVGVAPSSRSIDASVLTEGGARLPVVRGWRPSRLSEDEIARSVDDSVRDRADEATDGSDKTREGLGGVARPFLSDGTPRVDGLCWSTELLRVEVAF